LARRIHVQLIDDLSGEDAQETIRFSIDGADFEIDLSADNAADLRDRLKGYAAKGRRLRGPSGTSHSSKHTVFYTPRRQPRALY
jgi:hypothetical protein